MNITTTTGSLIPITYNDSDFIHELFSDADVKRYYVLRADHAKDIDSFISYMINCGINHTGMHYIIINENDVKVGLIAAELIRDGRTDEVMWNIACAITPENRNNGYATSALNALTTYLLNNFSIQKISLDISENNKESQAVALKCGYNKPTEKGKRAIYIDPEHVELGVRRKWYKSANGERALLFNKAMKSYMQRDYFSSIILFREALSKPYIQGTPFTDANIYCNLGLAYSGEGQYEDAFHCLKQAQQMGMNHPNLRKELQWLRDNVGLY